MKCLEIANLFNVENTIATEIFKCKTYPFEVLPEIGAFIKELIKTLDMQKFEKCGEDIYVAKSAKVAESAIEEAVLGLVDLRPAAIIKRFDLRRPIYCQIAAYGHMGREDVNAPWESCDLVPALQKLLK